MNQYRRIKALVSLDAVEFNFESMHKKIPPDAQMIAVIKADGYGHGADAIAHLIHDYPYIWGFAVAAPDEALELRRAGVTKPVLILGLVFPEFFDELAEMDIRIPVMDEETARLYAEAGRRTGHTVYVHIPVDTGMSRIGLAPCEESVPAVKSIAAVPGLVCEGMFTHFARADETDPSPAYVQLDRFDRFCGLLSAEDIRIPLIHASNSAGIMRIPEAHKRLVRAGISIYGIYPSEEVEREALPLKSAMRLVSHVTLVKEVPEGTAVSYGGTFVTGRKTRLATVPVGYADGYPRQLSGKGWVLIRGKKAPICGRVCMDQFMVDVTDIPGAAAFDEVTLLGRDGDEEITADILGNLSGRFPYELVCCISKRVPRIFIYHGKEQGTEF